MHRSIQETYHVIPSTAFSKLSYVLQHSTHGVTEADGGKKISLEYLTEKKFYPLSTTDEYFEAPYEEYPITICGQTVILTNRKLAALFKFRFNGQTT